MFDRLQRVQLQTIIAIIISIISMGISATAMMLMCPY